MSREDRLISLLVLGSGSLIAQKAAANFAAKGHKIFFAGRNIEEANKLAEDFKIRYKAECYSGYFDALDYDSHKKFFDDVITRFPDLDFVLVAFGYLGEQERSQNDFKEAHKTIDTNFTGAVSICETAAKYFEPLKKGTIVVISSVAGDRGRQSNYMYGSSKAGLTAYTSGLRSRLAKSNVNLVTIKPGFVDTPMTYGMKMPGPIVASADKVGRDIYNAAIKGKSIAYTPFYWRFIMMIVTSIPEFIFKKLKL